MPISLHILQTTQLDHLQKWIIHFMERHEQLEKFNAVCFSIPPYHDLTPKDKTSKIVSQ